MTKDSTPTRTMGLDVGKKRCRYVLGEGERDGVRILEQGWVATNGPAITKLLGDRERTRVVMEVGRASPWLSRLVTSLGHETIVANPRELAMIYKSQKKNDREDARKLMEVGHLNPKLLSPVHHRSAKSQSALAVIRSRDLAVGTRTSLVNHVRGSCASMGEPLESCSAASFHKQAGRQVPEELKVALAPVLKVIGGLTKTIGRYDSTIEAMAEKEYPATERLRQVKGVGPITSLCFVLTLEDPKRFPRSRAVGAYLGLTPKQDDSGDSEKQLHITKAGDAMLRRLLVGSAQYILGRYGPDTDLRRWGLQQAERGGKNAKKRAVVAVARKLAVLLHSLWVSGSTYEPLREETAAKPGKKRVRAYRITASPTRRPSPSGEDAAAAKP